jgi:hypothetical protein
MITEGLTTHLSAETPKGRDRDALNTRPRTITPNFGIAMRVWLLCAYLSEGLPPSTDRMVGPSVVMS